MDDLTRIKGIGKATAARLAKAGIDSFEKLAHDVVAGQHGVEVSWIAAAVALLHENTEGKPLRPEDGPEASSRDRAGLPADGRAGDRRTDVSEAPKAGGAGDPADPARIVRIRSKREGFRRCGFAHSKQAIDHPAGRFSPNQLERLLAEPMLIVEFI